MLSFSNFGSVAASVLPDRGRRQWQTRVQETTEPSPSDGEMRRTPRSSRELWNDRLYPFSRVREANVLIFPDLESPPTRRVNSCSGSGRRRDDRAGADGDGAGRFTFCTEPRGERHRQHGGDRGGRLADAGAGLKRVPGSGSHRCSPASSAVSIRAGLPCPWSTVNPRRTAGSVSPGEPLPRCDAGTDHITASAQGQRSPGAVWARPGHLRFWRVMQQWQRGLLPVAQNAADHAISQEHLQSLRKSGRSSSRRAVVGGDSALHKRGGDEAGQALAF